MLEDIFDRIALEYGEAIDIYRNLLYITLSHGKVEVSKQADTYQVVVHTLSKDIVSTSSNLASAIRSVTSRIKDLDGRNKG